MEIYAIANYIIGPIIGVAIILIGLCVVVLYLVFLLIKLLVRSVIKSFENINNGILRKKNKQIFFDKLISSYNISFNQDSKINKKLLMVIDEITTKYYCPTELSNNFNDLKETMRASLNQASIWTNNEILTDYSYKNKGLSRSRLHFTDKGFLNSTEHLCSNFFTIKTNGIKLHFFPYFIIAEIDCEYDLIEFTDISIVDKSSISVEESSTSKIKGANPAYYNYLHQRIDGGPDRRYKNNPSTPVYLYDAFKLNVGKEIQIISASNKSTLNIINGINIYKCELNKYQVLSAISVKDIDTSNNEFAKLIKKIIAEYGKNFILSKSFINHLKDYKVSIQYPYFIPIVEILHRSDSLKNIIQDDCNYKQLDIIKNTLIQSTTYSEKEIATVLAFIGQGVGLKV